MNRRKHNRKRVVICTALLCLLSGTASVASAELTKYYFKFRSDGTVDLDPLTINAQGQKVVLSDRQKATTFTFDQVTFRDGDFNSPLQVITPPGFVDRNAAYAAWQSRGNDTCVVIVRNALPHPQSEVYGTAKCPSDTVGGGRNCDDDDDNSLSCRPGAVVTGQATLGVATNLASTREQTVEVSAVTRTQSTHGLSE